MQITLHLKDKQRITKGIWCCKVLDREVIVQHPNVSYFIRSPEQLKDSYDIEQTKNITIR